MKYILFFIIVILYSCCGGNSDNNSQNNNESNCSANNETAEAITWGETIQLHGYIGNNAIEAEFTFDTEGNNLKGKYRYVKSNNYIPLKMESVDWYGGNQYTLVEEDTKRQVTGKWINLHYDINESYNGWFTSADEKTSLKIVLLDNKSKNYLDGNSKMIFENKNECTAFFKINKFLHNETFQKQGVIVDGNISFEGHPISENLLPVGINIYQLDGSDVGTLEIAGKVSEGNKIIYTNKESFSFDDAKIQIEEVGYETYCCRFTDVFDQEFISLRVDIDNDIFLSIKELNKLGWYLLGDCQQIKQKSGHVLGYYPRYKENPTSESDKYPINLYKTFDNTKKPILVVSNEDGFFLIEDVIFYNNDYWVKTTYEYHTTEPCSDEKIEPKPSVKGWIKLYDNDGTMKKKVLFHYSRAC